MFIFLLIRSSWKVGRKNYIYEVAAERAACSDVIQRVLLIRKTQS